MRYIIFFFLFYSATKAGAQTSALSIADSLYAVGNYTEAIQTLENIDPGSETIDLKLARSFQANGNLQEARSHFEKVLKNDPEKVLSLIDYANLLERMEELEKADSIFSKLSRRFPRNANFHYRLGQIREERKDSSAIDQYYLAVFTDPAHQQALFKVAKDALKNARFYASEKYSKQGLEHFPGNAGFLSLLAQTYFHQARYDLAAENFQLLLDQGEETEFIYSTMAASLYHLKRYDEAIESYKKALQYKEDEAQNHFSLGKLYAITGELDKAEEHLLKTIILRTPILDSEYLSLGLTYSQKKDYQKALQYFSRALEENPDNERALFERAIAADNYFEDLQSKITYYQDYLDKYSELGKESMVGFAERRKTELREQLHLSKGK